MSSASQTMHPCINGVDCVQVKRSAERTPHHATAKAVGLSMRCVACTYKSTDVRIVADEAIRYGITRIAQTGTVDFSRMQPLACLHACMLACLHACMTFTHLRLVM